MIHSIQNLTLLMGLFFLTCAARTELGISNDRVEEKPIYRLGYGDVIEIKFFDNERFNREVIVRPDGRITLEKAGDIWVEGLSTQQIDSIITDKYSDYLKNPEVIIFVKQFGNQKVYVLGEVNMPGSYTIEKNLSVVHVLALAGGVKRSANLNSVLLLRRTETGNLAGERLKLKKLFSGKFNNDDRLVQPLDIVYVPKTFIADVDAFVDQFFDLILPPVDVFWRLWFIEQMNKE